MMGQLVDFIPDARFCSRRCRRTSQHTGLAECAACGGPRDRDARVYRALAICQDCRALGWDTCWGKVVHWREPEPVVHEGRTLHPYRCLLCHGWHRTKLPPGFRMSDEYLVRKRQLAALIRSRNFNIDVHRNREHEEQQA